MSVVDKTLQDHTKQINRAIDYINLNLNRSITIDELSSLVDLSTYHFHRIFTSLIGEPIGKYILRRRLERAANVLLGEPVAIKDVAYDGGFSSVSSFAVVSNVILGYLRKSIVAKTDIRIARIVNSRA